MTLMRMIVLQHLPLLVALHPKNFRWLILFCVYFLCINQYFVRLIDQNNPHFFSRVISGGTSPRGLPEAYSLVKVQVAGRSTQKELDRNFYKKWVTNQAKAWARMLKVGRSEVAELSRCLLIYFLLDWKSRVCIFHLIPYYCCRYCKPH